MHRIDSSTATPDNKFTEGDPTIPVAATTVTADWLNAVQEEIVKVVLESGLELDKSDNTQLLQALLKIIGVKAPIATTKAPGLVQVGTGLSVTAAGLLSVLAATAARAGIVELATTDEAKAGKDGTRAVTPEGLAAWGAGLSGVPRGGIISFSGSFGGTGNRFPIPLGESAHDPSWCLCDGVTTNGFAVPDLRDRMILGAGPKHPAGSTGGSETHDHSVSGTVGATTLTESQLAAHGHTAQLRSGHWDNFGQLPEGQPYGSGVADWTTRTSEKSHNTGSSQSHTHSLVASTGTASSLSPYYALAYIMRVA